MSDISKRGGTDDCESGERGERGKRGKRGHRGHRGHEGPQGPAGPGGPATSLVGPTSGDGVIIAAEDIPVGSVIAAGGSAVQAVGDLDKYCNDPSTSPTDPKCRNCIVNPFPPPTGVSSCGAGKVLGVASANILAGEAARYVAAGPLTLDASIWDGRTGGSGGLVPNAIYYLAATTPGHMTTVKPTSGEVIQVGIAFDARTLDVQLQVSPAQGDGLTIIGSGTLTAISYGYGRINVFGSDSETWQLAAPGSVLPGTPMRRNQALTGFGQQAANAAAWLTAHVIGLFPGFDISSAENSKFISGGLFRLTEAQWNAVWTAADPNRGVGSGLLPGYPYYLSDVPGTFFLIDKTGVPPVAPGNWITKCFVALSPTVALIQIGDPRKFSTAGGGLHTENTSTTQLTLPNSSDTEVLSCPSIVPGVGNFVQITGDVGIQLIGNTIATNVVAIVTLREDGVEIARYAASLATVSSDGAFNFFGSIPVAWTFSADGSPHVYSINVSTDPSSDGSWTAQNRAMFVNVLPPP